MLVFAERLRAARRAKRVSQAVLAGKIGVSRATLQRWEKADRAEPPSAMDVNRIADVLNVNILYLLGVRAEPARGLYLENHEAALLRDYRALDAAAQQAVREMLADLLQTEQIRKSAQLCG